ncbi:MAG: hypothetical protein ACI93R_003161 [Flavobacteriales bacterium]|jgi:hypothetical protein
MVLTLAGYRMFDGVFYLFGINTRKLASRHKGTHTAQYLERRTKFLIGFKLT